MIVLRDPAAVTNIADSVIRSLVAHRFAQVWEGETYDPELHGYMIVVEPGDSMDALEKESGCYILHSLFGDARFGHPDFSASFEFLDEHASCFEMVFIISDDGYGIDIFIPKVAGIDAELLAMCAQYATPALTPKSS